MSTSFVKLPFSCLLLCKIVNNTERIQLLSTMVFYRKNWQITDKLLKQERGWTAWMSFRTNAQRLQRSVAMLATACRPYKYHWKWKKVHGNQLAMCLSVCLSVSHLLTTLTHYHTFTVPFQAQNSPFPQIFSTIVSYSTHLDCLLGLYWTGLTLLNGFPFLV